jgi:hypothetical protein
MTIVPQPQVKAKYATVYDEPCTIAKWGQALYVIYDDGRVEEFEVEMAPFTTILGDVHTGALQAMWDRIRGNAVGVCLTRSQEVR